MAWPLFRFAGMFWTSEDISEAVSASIAIAICVAALLAANVGIRRLRRHDDRSYLWWIDWINERPVSHPGTGRASVGLVLGIAFCDLVAVLLLAEKVTRPWMLAGFLAMWPPMAWLVYQLQGPKERQPILWYVLMGCCFNMFMWPLFGFLSIGVRRVLFGDYGV